MDKSRSFSIFLLKAGYDAENALEDRDGDLDEDVVATTLPNDATLFVLDTPSYPPWWKDYFGIKGSLRQATKGALVFVPAADRCFALAFGHVSHFLDSESYEHDFGIRVTLNCVDPVQLRSTDSFDPGVGRRQRVQMPIDSDLTLLDFDQDNSVLRRLTGRVKEQYKHLYKDATGASNLRVNLKIDAEQLPDLCASVLALYSSKAYKTVFPHIQDISPVRDPGVVTGLNESLVSALRAKDETLALAVPDLINYEDSLYASFRGAGASDLYDEVYIDRYYEYLTANEVPLAAIDVATLKRHKLLLMTEDGAARGPVHTIFKSLLFDVTGADGTFHFNDGNWYRVEPQYLASLEQYLDARCADLTLPAYNHMTEGAYNAAVDANFVCLDKTNISPTGQTQVEPCDLYAVEGDAAIFYHVKVSTLSSELSHHFNQGANALELVRSEPASLEKLRNLLKDRTPKARHAALLAPLGSRNHGVRYAIVTHKPKEAKALNLPLFSRISLRRVMRFFDVADVNAVFGFVPDARAPAPGRPKPRKPRKKTKIKAG